MLSHSHSRHSSCVIRCFSAEVLAYTFCSVCWYFLIVQSVFTIRRKDFRTVKLCVFTPKRGTAVTPLFATARPPQRSRSTPHMSNDMALPLKHVVNLWHSHAPAHRSLLWITCDSVPLGSVAPYPESHSPKSCATHLPFKLILQMEKGSSKRLVIEDCQLHVNGTDSARPRPKRSTRLRVRFGACDEDQLASVLNLQRVPNLPS